MDDNFKEQIIELLIEDGTINKESLRDYRIRKFYVEFKKNGMTGKEARLKLADKFFTSEKNIERILYRSK